MRFALGYCFDSFDIFEKFDLKKIHFTQKETWQYFHDYSKIRFVHYVFMKMLKYIMNDIIDNDIEFIFPGRSNFSMYVKRYAGEDFKKLRRLGVFQDVDFLKTNFSALALVIHRKNRNIKDPILRVYISGDEKRKLIEHTENQTIFYQKKEKKVVDYKGVLQEMFPTLNIKDLLYIMTYGFDSVYRHIQYGGDICFKVRDFLFLVGKLTTDSLKHKAYYQSKLITKLGVLYNRRKKPTDDYYYFQMPKNLIVSDEIVKQKLWKYEILCDLAAATNKLYKILRTDLNSDGTIPFKKAIYIRDGTNFTMKDLMKINKTIWQDKRR